MLFLNDVWVNWFEGEENGYNVCPFHEWRREDVVELLDQVPVVKVTSTLFHYIENDMSELPKNLLEMIKNQSYMRKNHERVQLEYCFIVTDGKGILAVDTIGYMMPIRKSRLIPRQEQQVYDLISNEAIFETDTVLYIKEEKDHHLLSPSPLFMYGLTRKERQMKQLLFMALDTLFTTQNNAELKYWYTEWEPRVYQEWSPQSFEEAWEQFFSQISFGWTNRHEELTEKMIKGQPFLERMLEMEKGSTVN